MTNESIAPQPDHDGGARGRTVIDDRVRRRLIEHAVEAVPGTSRHRAITARPLPSVKFADHDQREVEVQVAADWPLDAGKLVASVRSSVNAELERSLGEQPGEVRVHVARINDGERSSAPLLAAADAPVNAADSPAKGKLAPRRIAGSSIASVLVLLGLLALGIVALRDTVVQFGWAGGQQWLAQVAQFADNFRWDWWTWPAAVAAIVVGLVLVVSAIKPRSKSHTAVSNELWLSRNLIENSRKEGAQ